MTATKPTDKFILHTSVVFTDLDGQPMTEPGKPEADGKPGPRTDITLGVVLAAVVNSDTKADGVTLDVLDRLTLARRFKKGGECTVKVDTCEQLKKLVKAHFAHSPILAGQALELLGATVNDDL